jgi:hypothetical protein
MNYIVYDIDKTDGIVTHIPYGYVVGLENAKEFNDNNTSLDFIALPETVNDSIEGLSELATTAIV